MAKLRLSLANKCQLLFGAAVVLILTAALTVVWFRMENQVIEGQRETASSLALAWLNDMIELGQPLNLGRQPQADDPEGHLDTLADMAGELELSVVLKDLLVRAAALLDVTGGELAIHDQNTGELRIAASHNMGADAVGTTMAPGEGAMGQVAETMEPLIIPDYLEWEGRAATYTDGTVQSVMAAPLVIGTRLVGVLAVVHSEPGRRFGEDDIGLMKLFATQAAIANSGQRSARSSTRD